MSFNMASSERVHREPVKGHGAKYYRKKELLIAALIAHPTREMAAQEVGLSIKTVQRWLQIPEFAEAYHKARCEQSERLLPHLLNAYSEAQFTLIQVAKDETAPAAARCRAAESLLKNGHQDLELEAVCLRLRHWEQQQASPPSSLSPPNATPARAPRGHGAKFGPKKEAAVAALLKHQTVERAAQAIQVNPKTLQAWTRIPEFEQAFRQACWDKFSQLVATFQHAAHFAVATLQNVLRNGTQPGARVSAANVVFKMTRQTLADVEDIPLRVQRLTQQPPPPRGSDPPDLRAAA